jgi:DNA-binding NarL/FixJ family response regulator
MQHLVERRPHLALVIDSHSTVCAVLSRMLEHLGIRSVVAHGSAAAEALLASPHDQIDLVFAEIGGAHDCCAALVKRLRAERPDVSVVCVTPYETDLQGLGSTEHHVRLLKPFRAEDVIDAVTRATAA